MRPSTRLAVGARTSKENVTMSGDRRSHRTLQMTAWAVAGLFVLGFFYAPVGFWTGAILAAWFIGTQRPVRGLVLLWLFVFVPALPGQVRHFPWSRPEEGFADLGWFLLATILSMAPFVVHRLLSRRLPRWARPLPLPLAGSVFAALSRFLLPHALIFSPRFALAAFPL